MAFGLSRVGVGGGGAVGLGVTACSFAAGLAAVASSRSATAFRLSRVSVEQPSTVLGWGSCRVWVQGVPVARIRAAASRVLPCSDGVLAEASCGHGLGRGSRRPWRGRAGHRGWRGPRSPAQKLVRGNQVAPRAAALLLQVVSQPVGSGPRLRAGATSVAGADGSQGAADTHGTGRPCRPGPGRANSPAERVAVRCRSGSRGRPLLGSPVAARRPCPSGGRRPLRRAGPSLREERCGSGRSALVPRPGTG